MRGEAGDDVVVAITVHVVGEHLRAAAWGEYKLVSLPRLLVRGRLRKPTVLVNDVEPPIAIHIPHAQAVAKLLRSHRAGHRVERPFLERVFPIHRHVAELAALGADQFRPRVAHKIGQGRRLIAHPVKNLMPCPVTLRTPGIHVHVTGCAWEPDAEKIIPPVTVEVVNEPEKIVRVPIAILRLGRVNLVLRFKLRPRVPVWPRDNIRLAVMRHIAKPRALAVILSGKRQALKGMEKRFSSLNR